MFNTLIAAAASAMLASSAVPVAQTGSGSCYDKATSYVTGIFANEIHTDNPDSHVVMYSPYYLSKSGSCLAYVVIHVNKLGLYIEQLINPDTEEVLLGHAFDGHGYSQCADAKNSSEYSCASTIDLFKKMTLHSTMIYTNPSGY